MLRAPQPLDAWSRARWEPLARKLGPRPFLEAVADEKRDETDRIRAVEVLTELFHGLPPETADAARHWSAPRVRARVAWSMGRVFDPRCRDGLQELAKDADPRVSVAALSALADHIGELKSVSEASSAPGWGPATSGSARRRPGWLPCCRKKSGGI